MSLAKGAAEVSAPAPITRGAYYFTRNMASKALFRHNTRSLIFQPKHGSEGVLSRKPTNTYSLVLT